MSYIFARRERLKPTPLSAALQEEMYSSPYASQDWDKARNLCAKPDLYYPHPMVQVGPAAGSALVRTEVQSGHEECEMLGQKLSVWLSSG